MPDSTAPIHPFMGAPLQAPAGPAAGGLGAPAGGRLIGGGAEVSVWDFGEGEGFVEKRAQGPAGRAALRAEADRLRRAPPAVVPALLAEAPGGAWLRQARARGLPLHTWARGRPTAERRSALRALGEAVAALHAAGLSHGDLKPEHARVSARLGGAIDVQIIDLGAGDAAGRCFGSPGFAAPERLAGGPLRPAADLYALGAIAWAVLTGAPPPAWEPGPPADPRGPGLALSDAELSLLWRLLSPLPSARPSAAAAAAIWAEPGPARARLPAPLDRALRGWAGGSAPLVVGPAASPLLPRLLQLAGALAARRGARLAPRWTAQAEAGRMQVLLGPAAGWGPRLELPWVAPDWAAALRAALMDGPASAAELARRLQLPEPALIGAVEALVDLGALSEAADGQLRWAAG